MTYLQDSGSRLATGAAMGGWVRRFDIVAALLMLFFAVPKLLGASRSVAGFQVIADHVGLDPTGLRLATGAIELAIAVLLIAPSWQARGRSQVLALAGHVLLLGTMAGAVFTELVIRPGAAPVLLALALVLAGFSYLRLWQLASAHTTERARRASSDSSRHP